jgi:hypothetical protein
MYVRAVQFPSKGLTFVRRPLRWETGDSVSPPLTGVAAMDTQAGAVRGSKANTSPRARHVAHLVASSSLFPLPLPLESARGGHLLCSALLLLPPFFFRLPPRDLRGRAIPAPFLRLSLSPPRLNRDPHQPRPRTVPHAPSPRAGHGASLGAGPSSSSAAAARGREGHGLRRARPRGRRRRRRVRRPRQPPRRRQGAYRRLSCPVLSGATASLDGCVGEREIVAPSLECVRMDGWVFARSC